jgi:hypothetical protein
MENLLLIIVFESCVVLEWSHVKPLKFTVPIAIRMRAKVNKPRHSQPRHFTSTNLQDSGRIHEQHLLAFLTLSLFSINQLRLYEKADHDSF